jgi:predicted AlkP superfamily phosphohydrolase/phosphomutase
MKTRLYLIGLDGATFRILRPWIDEGILPNLGTLLETGSSGELQSTIPPFTATAWTTMVTGKNPGKHGVFDFLIRTPESKGKKHISSLSIGSKKLWNVLNDQGIATGILNFPISYPVEEVDGFMVSGFLTPRDARDFTHPIELFDAIPRAIGDYVINVPLPLSGRFDTLERALDFIRRVRYQTEKRIEAFWFLIRRFDTPFVMAVFMLMDQIQHVLWKYVDEQEEAFYDSETGKRLREEIVRCYRMLDDFLGKLRAEMDDNATLLIVSDHGFGPLKRNFYVNKWLLDQGLLSIRGRTLLTHRFLRKLGISHTRKKQNLYGGNMSSGENWLLNWDETRAFGSHPSEQAIYLNVEGREENGIVSGDKEYDDLKLSIKERLYDLKVGETGERIVDRVTGREEVHTGSFVEYAPDLYVKLEDYSCMLSPLLSVKSKGYFREVTLPAGSHREEGIFIAAGNHVRKGTQKTPKRIQDIAPTALHLLGVPVPKDMDGTVLTEILDEDFLRNTPVRYQSVKPQAQEERSDRKIYTKDQEQELEDKLKGLGYL